MSKRDLRRLVDKLMGDCAHFEKQVDTLSSELSLWKGGKNEEILPTPLVTDDEKEDSSRRGVGKAGNPNTNKLTRRGVGSRSVSSIRQEEV